ncbi:hypothetical protein [Desulfolutivibrio sulfoxidireducens]|uniref:hypothetical protein n=1 Tax=Desulfolutivibrio sulfoxidireducens TaxID=2773299 RepID=UPI00159D76D7|nr:hypothetical protein [Desulfolutivibrio sulfoxidireducens]QLA15147.1 hypothetical protein GD605_02835 [Desulfolutivibrio sulfoxidireducens]
MQRPDADTPVPGENGGTFSQKDRLAACLALHEDLKERKARREVQEERVFLEFIRVNRDRINEFPLLDIEQKGLIDILLRRGADHPGQAFIKGLIGEFIAELNKYGKALAVGAEAEAEAHLKELVGAEALLVKCVQGAVYACSLVKDNVSDSIILHFGESALEKIEEITERLEFDETWWRACLDTFVRERIAAGHAGIVARERYTVFREGGFAGVRLPFDEVLATLRGTDKVIQKTRVQSAYEDREENEEGRRVVAFLAAFLASGQNPVTEAGASPSTVRHLARIAAMDPAGTEYAGAATPETEDDSARYDFLAAQVTALASGAALVLSVAARDFDRAIRDFDARERRLILSLAGHFERARLERLVPLILEFAYLQVLRDMGREEGGKVVIRTVRARRAVAAEVMALADPDGGGLTRIGRRRLFETEPGRPDMLAWKPRTLEEMNALCAVLQLDEAVAARIAALWETAPFRVEFLVAVNLEAVAKVTSNPAHRVAEILARFGVAPRRVVRPQAAGPAATQTSPAVAGQTLGPPAGANQGEKAP